MRIRNCSLAAAGLVAALSLGLVLSRAPLAASGISLSVEGRSSSNPWIDAVGSFAVVAWGASSAGKTDVFVAVSRDGGRTFGAPVQVNTTSGEARLGGELPPRVALAPKSGSAEPEIVVLWTARGATTEIKESRSLDGGRTFGPSVTLQTAGAPGDRGWPALTMDASGAAHVVWLDHRGLAVDPAAKAHRHKDPGYDGVAMAQKSGLYYAAAKLSSSSTGERELAKGVCYCCKTALVAGRKGELYAAWRHVYPGNYRDMAVAVSRDGGATFSAPVRVSEDGWSITGCPDDGPAMAVDATGAVHLVWPTVIGGSNPEGILVHASTRDGRTFSHRTRIPTLGSPKPSHPQVLVDRHGRIVVAWDEVKEGRRVAAVRELKPRGDRDAEFGPIVEISSDGPALYPVLTATDRGLLAVWTTGGDASTVQARIVQLP
jgi:hypothetical protein